MNTDAKKGSMAALCSGVALMNAAMAVGSATSILAAGDGMSMTWSSVPNTVSIIGTGIGAITLTRLIARLGKRTVLFLGYLVAALGAGVCVVAVSRGDMVALGVGMLLLGLGNAGAQFSRYTAADLFPSERRGFAISLVVWAAAVGAVGGPLLLGPTGQAAGHLGLTALAGPFVLAALTCVAATAAASRVRTPRTLPPAPSSLPHPAGPQATRFQARALQTKRPTRSSSLWGLLAAPVTRSALTVMLTAQVVMVVVMTAVPMDMHAHRQSLASVGMTLSAHTLGMFALSPLTGHLADRAGPRPVILAGLLTLVASTGMAALAGEHHAPVQMIALFLLGYAWNLCFVGGSSLLATHLPEPERTDIEGAVDSAIWSTAALASLASTAVLSTAGDTLLLLGACILSAAMTLLTLVIQFRTNPAPSDLSSADGVGLVHAGGDDLA
jgi:MFS family permease